ncbi:ORF6N domain-containing protein [Paludibacter jiangxiensis]|uniref:ORF6N domain-containing protein n=2 Tax=Paludibacter jiangxiensis TaxID=681398 RepID=A0A170Y5K7_9BACT|nr:ORF6N domain-containing protein [Paludibacter jiangxiensis]
MLDRDLAEMYGVETRRLNEQIKRNIRRFPDDFMFQLKREEFEILMSQFATSSWGGTRKLPYAFTELGVAMLSSVLNSDTAIEINMGIMRAFVTIRQALAYPQADRYEELKQYMDEILIDQNDINEDTRMQLELINQTLAELQTDKRFSDKPRRRVGFHRED